MPRYIFDVHDDGPVEWGDTSYLLTERDQIEGYVRQLIDEAQRRQRERGSTDPLTTVFVHAEDDGIVLTAYGKPGEDLRLVWSGGTLTAPH